MRRAIVALVVIGKSAKPEPKTRWIETREGPRQVTEYEWKLWNDGRLQGERMGRQDEQMRQQMHGPMEPQEVQKAREEIEAKWEKEFQFAENLRAALVMVMEMCDKEEPHDEIHDVANDALTDQASDRLISMRRKAQRRGRDPLIERHMRGGSRDLPPMPESMPHHPHDPFGDPFYGGKHEYHPPWKPGSPSYYDEVVHAKLIGDHGHGSTYTAPTLKEVQEVLEKQAAMVADKHPKKKKTKTVMEEVVVNEMGGGQTTVHVPVDIIFDEIEDYPHAEAKAATAVWMETQGHKATKA